MAIEAARTALGRGGISPRQVGALWVGTESKPYAVKPSATIVAEALGITPHLVASDLEFACKAGTEAMQAIDELAIDAAAHYARVDQPDARRPGANVPAIGPDHSLIAMPRYLNNRAASIYGGSNQIQRDIMARLVLGL